MDRGWYLRFSTVLASTLLAWCALWPSLDRWVPAPAFIKSTFSGRLSPGLDIRGGLRLMYEVEVDEYIRDTRDRRAEQLQRKVGVKLGVLTEEEAASPTEEKLVQPRARVRVERTGETGIRLKFQSAADKDKITREWLRESFDDLRIDRTSSSGNDLVVMLREERLERLRETAVGQAVRTIHERVDTLGLREAAVSGREQDVIVEIPGADDAMFERIRGIISRTARLEFKVVADGENDWIPAELPQGITRSQESAPAGEGRPSVQSDYLVTEGTDGRERLQAFVATLQIPEGHQVAIGQLPADQDSGSARVERWRTYHLLDSTEVTGEDIEDAFTSFDPQTNNPIVSLQFKQQGAREFEEMTGRNVQRRMAIVLDDRVENAPVIQQRIGGGRAQITLGSFLDYNKVIQEADDLVVVLKAGALPAPLRPSNEQLIGPTLGRDAVEQGIIAAGLGIALVLVLMAVYYEAAGLVANLMVLINLLMQLALMAAFEATITLPGIAAIALTVGMAVDANVLITERIREELRIGKSPRSAVEQGYDRAFSSILDSQLTTLIAGVVLFQFGTGPIKGFAVMLMIGIVTSLFTGIFCSKVAMDGIVRGLRVERLRVG